MIDDSRFYIETVFRVRKVLSSATTGRYGSAQRLSKGNCSKASLFARLQACLPLEAFRPFYTTEYADSPPAGWDVLECRYLSEPARVDIGRAVETLGIACRIA